MKLFWKKEKRATEFNNQAIDSPTLLETLLGVKTIDRGKALQIPTVAACINKIADIIATLPIRLYEHTENGSNEVTDDARVKILNQDTGGTMTATEFWRAMLQDYYLGRGGYAYIEKRYNEVKSIRYVQEEYISVNKNADPIFVDYNILCNGNIYLPCEFFKILRNTRDGAEGKSILEEHNMQLVVAYNYLIFERKLSRSGGRRKGFLTTQGKSLDSDTKKELKEMWSNLYNEDTDRALILTGGLDFKQANDSPKDLELNDTKKSIATEICMIFNIPPAILMGGGTEKDQENFLKQCIIPIVKTIEDAVNRDLLLESEKGKKYFSIDTKTMNRGSIKERFEAYELAIKAGWMNRNEVRGQEDLSQEEGMEMYSFTLADVLYNAENHSIIIPNMGKVIDLYNLESCASTTVEGGDTE